MRGAWLCLLVACNFERGDAAPDAFDIARDCPTTYTLELPGQTSRYRVNTRSARPWEHSDDCTDDLVGATHLVAIDDQAELDAIEAFADGPPGLRNNRAWIGGVQPSRQAAPIDGWLSVTGGPMIQIWNNGEPNDGGGDQIEDDQENFVGVERSRQGLVDFPSNFDQDAICECDGKLMDATATAAIDARRP